jgi:hypothetical protein
VQLIDTNEGFKKMFTTHRRLATRGPSGCWYSTPTEPNETAIGSWFAPGRVYSLPSPPLPLCLPDSHSKQHKDYEHRARISQHTTRRERTSKSCSKNVMRRADACNDRLNAMFSRSSRCVNNMRDWGLGDGDSDEGAAVALATTCSTSASHAFEHGSGADAASGNPLGGCTLESDSWSHFDGLWS